MTDRDAALQEVRATDKELQDARRSAEKRLTHAQDRRDQAVKRAHEAGASYRAIAEVLGVAHNYVYEIVNGPKRKGNK